MRKWLLMLAILGMVYLVSKIGRKKEDRSPFLKRLNETLSLLAWALVAAYTLFFLYWLYTQIFRK